MKSKDKLFYAISSTLFNELTELDRVIHQADQNADITTQVFGQTYYVPVAQDIQSMVEADCKDINLYARMHKNEIDLPN